MIIMVACTFLQYCTTSLTFFLANGIRAAWAGIVFTLIMVHLVLLVGFTTKWIPWLQRRLNLSKLGRVPFEGVHVFGFLSSTTIRLVLAVLWHRSWRRYRQVLREFVVEYYRWNVYRTSITMLVAVCWLLCLLLLIALTLATRL